ncbi:hypothetical protein [Streptomyces sp. NPDC006879]|uniref:hypothetical protein n=1 Tax=Streptomyces sp. NPDC006879 TaxID=3364767 RepID=UPI00369D84CD
MPVLPAPRYAGGDVSPGTTTPDVVRLPGSGSHRRRVAAAASAALGLLLLGVAVGGGLFSGDPQAPAEDVAYTRAAAHWHSAPVDALFPPTLNGDGAGPGGADRTWTRVAVAPDGPCTDVQGDPVLALLEPVGCARLLRATYTDATRSSLITAGLLFTEADPAGMVAMRSRFHKEKLLGRMDLIPSPYGPQGTSAEGFGRAQAASWTVSVLTDAPVVVYAVSGFADGREVTKPRPAASAMTPGASSPASQSGMGYEAKGVADRVERTLRRTVTAQTETTG